MKAIKKYPNWVNKQHAPGTSIKQIGDNYYLYSVTSKYDKNKGYPVSIQRYVGKITKDGLIKPETVSFIPSKDKLYLFKDCLDISMFTSIQQKAIKDLPVLFINGVYYTGSISSKVEKILTKHFDYKEGTIYGQL